jgi:hypothetical protein
MAVKIHLVLRGFRLCCPLLERILQLAIVFSSAYFTPQQPHTHLLLPSYIGLSLYRTIKLQACVFISLLEAQTNIVAVADIFKHGWLKAFTVMTVFGANSLIALIEVFFLSSIRRQNVSGFHPKKNKKNSSALFLTPSACLGTHRGSHSSFIYVHRLGKCWQGHHWPIRLLLPGL